MTAMAWHLADSTLFAIFIAILCACMRRRGPATRYALLLIAAAKFVLPLRLFSWLGEGLAGLLPARPVPASVATTVYGIYGRAGSAPVFQPANGSPHALISCALFAIWLLGTAAAFALWLRRLHSPRPWQDHASDLAGIELSRLKRRIGLRGEIRLRLSRELAEPALVGFWNPVVLIPAGLAERLSAAELESVVLHELAHAKRRDNWTAAFAHAVRCIFWFYPLLCWIEKRLHSERELACDELVVRSGAAPEDYLSSILKVCRFHVSESPAGVCGVCGSNLKNRMETVMSLTSDVPFRRVPKLFLASLLAAIAAVPLIVGVLTNPRTARAAGDAVSGVACRIARQPGAPARLNTVTFGASNLVLGATLENVGTRPVTSYRIGWLVRYPGGKTETAAGPTMAVPTGIVPGATEQVPAQGGGPINALSSRGARALVVFVKELHFADGGRWQADVSSIEKAPPLRPEARGVTVGVASGVSGGQTGGVSGGIIGGQSAVQAEEQSQKSQKPLTCASASVDYPEGTVIELGNQAEQMCVRAQEPVDSNDPAAGLRDVAMWVQISDAARQRAAAVIHLPQPPPVRCSPEPPNGSKLCSCAGAGEFSPGAVVWSADGASQLSCDNGKWVGIIRVGGSIEAAMVAHTVAPEYPPAAKAAHVQGAVVFRAIIGKDGTIQWLQYVSGPQMLVAAARKAVLQWRYRPTYLNGEPVEVDTSIQVTFSLF